MAAAFISYSAAAAAATAKPGTGNKTTAPAFPKDAERVSRDAGTFFTCVAEVVASPSLDYRREFVEAVDKLLGDDVLAAHPMGNVFQVLTTTEEAANTLCKEAVVFHGEKHFFFRDHLPQPPRDDDRLYEVKLVGLPLYVRDDDIEEVMAKYGKVLEAKRLGLTASSGRTIFDGTALVKICKSPTARCPSALLYNGKQVRVFVHCLEKPVRTRNQSAPQRAWRTATSVPADTSRGPSIIPIPEEHTMSPPPGATTMIGEAPTDVTPMVTTHMPVPATTSSTVETTATTNPPSSPIREAVVVVQASTSKPRARHSNSTRTSSKRGKTAPESTDDGMDAAPASTAFSEDDELDEDADPDLAQALRESRREHRGKGRT